MRSLVIDANGASVVRAAGRGATSCAHAPVAAPNATELLREETLRAIQENCEGVIVKQATAPCVTRAPCAHRQQRAAR